MALMRVASAPGPLFDRRGTRSIEASALACTPPHALMERAGWAVARLALAIAPHARRVQIACGPGNNGGDGLVAARHLHTHGRDVVVHLVSSATPPADAAWALGEAVQAGVQIVRGLPHGPGAVEADLHVDALLGLGAERPLEGALAAWSDQVAGRPVLAVDQPSGLNADTGMPWPGGVAVRATHTLALLTLKPGLFTAHGRDHAGQVWLEDLGVEPGAVDPVAWLHDLADPVGMVGEQRPHASHKGSFGDVLVVGGAAGMSGAAVLAAHAALAAGAGRVHLAPLAAGYAPPALRPEVMTRDAAWRTDPVHLVDSTVVCGCGGGNEVHAALAPLVEHAPRLVLDADALNAVARDPALAAAVAARAARGMATVLTPHPLEAARLLGSSNAAVMADRLAAARALADHLDSIVVLKGSGTLVAAPGLPTTVNASGNAALATAGTGDVLAGWIGGRWSASRPTGSAGVAAFVRAAVWQHGRAADLHGPASPLRAADLVEHLHGLLDRRSVGGV